MQLMIAAVSMSTRTLYLAFTHSKITEMEQLVFDFIHIELHTCCVVLFS